MGRRMGLGRRLPAIAGLAAILLLVVALPVRADRVSAGERAYRSGQYEEAFRIWKPLADRGDSGAQYWIGQLHYYGLGPVEQSDRAAIDWYSRAASGGSGDALYRLGDMHARGVGTPANAARAVEFWTRAAKAGHQRSMLRMADNYEKGAFLPRDERQARYWFREAALRGSLEGMIRLALNLQGTEQLPRDYTRAYMWLLVARERGSAEAARLLKSLRMKFHGDEIERAEQLAREYLRNGTLPPRLKDEI